MLSASDLVEQALLSAGSRPSAVSRRKLPVLKDLRAAHGAVGNGSRDDLGLQQLHRRWRQWAAGAKVCRRGGWPVVTARQQSEVGVVWSTGCCNVWESLLSHVHAANGRRCPRSILCTLSFGGLCESIGSLSSELSGCAVLHRTISNSTYWVVANAGSRRSGKTMQTASGLAPSMLADLLMRTFLQPGSLGMDALHVSWEGHQLCFSSAFYSGSCCCTRAQGTADVLMIAPEWPSALWWPQLTSQCSEVADLPPGLTPFGAGRSGCPHPFGHAFSNADRVQFATFWLTSAAAGRSTGWAEAAVCRAAAAAAACGVLGCLSSQLHRRCARGPLRLCGPMHPRWSSSFVSATAWACQRAGFVCTPWIPMRPLKKVRDSTFCVCLAGQVHVR